MIHEKRLPRLAFQTPQGVASKDYDFEVDYKEYLMDVVTSQLSIIQNYLNENGYRIGGSDIKFKRIQTLVRSSNFGYTISLRYKMTDENVSVLGDFTVTDDSQVISELVVGGNAPLVQGIHEVTYQMLQRLRESIVRDLNMMYFNQFLKQIRPKSSPYLVQFALTDKSTKAVSELAPNKVTWVVNPDFFIGFEDLFIGDACKNNVKLVKETFYSFISVVDYLVNSNRDLFSGYLSGYYEVGDSTSFTGVLKHFALPVIEEKRQKSKLIYRVKDDIVSVFQLVVVDSSKRKQVRAYIEVMQIHNKTWEVYELDNPVIYDVTDTGLSLRVQ